MKNIFKYGLAVIGLGLLFSACEDFLNTKPLDKMVEEDYWKTRSDVQSVLLAGYKVMASDDYMERIMIGGEFRSDNVVKVKGYTDQKLIDIMEMNIQTDNDLLKWQTFYTLINYCNRVLNRAPQIAGAIDPDYTQGMLEVDLGEARAMRAMAYFYLVRMYRDVPYIDFPYDDDTKPFAIPKTHGDTIITRIIEDLRLAENQVVVTHGMSSSTGSQIRQYTKGRFTKNSVRALLADALLWKASGLPEAERTASYQECVEVCKRVEDNILDWNVAVSTNELDGSELWLIPNSGDGVGSAGSTSYSYYSVFYRENSEESIFELQFASSYLANNKLASYYGNLTDKPHVQASSKTLESLFTAAATDQRKADSYHETAAGSETYVVAKYVTSVRNGNNPGDYGYRMKSAVHDANWIFYRVPDVYLMHAEALVELGELHEALDLVNLVYQRANAGGDPLLDESYSTRDAMRELVLAERRREFLFEGKRWFDLVRMARRDGLPGRLRLATLVSANSEYSSDVLKTKLSNMNALFLPIYRKELLSNSALTQNEYYASESTNKK